MTLRSKARLLRTEEVGKSDPLPPLSFMAKTPEGRLTQKIISALKKEGGFWFKVHGSAFQRAGIPDIVGCYLGRFVALEVKLPHEAENVSEVQRLMISRIVDAGGISKVVTSTMDAVEVTDMIDKSFAREES